MSFSLVYNKGNAVPIHSVTTTTFPAWLERNPQSRDWISTVGFKAEPGSFAFVPGRDAGAPSVLASPNEGGAGFRVRSLAFRAARGNVCARSG